jgi:predicted amidohydrolase
VDRTSAITIGMAQWHAECNAPERNLHDALDVVASLAGSGCELIVLPELWPCGYDPITLDRDARAAAEPLDGPRGHALAEAAGRHRVWLFAGTVPELVGDALYNTAVVYGPDGTLRATHRKVHLYTPLGEDAVFATGEQATVVDAAGIGTVGLSICFDGDHPSYARRLHELGARIVVSPCAYETAAESWWNTLYPANALANGQWWLMANQIGGGLLGGSRVIAPDGTVRAEARRVGNGDRPETPWAGDAERPEVVVARLDLAAEIEEAERSASALWAAP